MLPFLYLIIDVVIVLAYIALLALDHSGKVSQNNDFAWPDWLTGRHHRGHLVRSLAGFALYLRLKPFSGWVLSHSAASWLS